MSGLTNITLTAKERPSCCFRSHSNLSSIKYQQNKHDGFLNSRSINKKQRVTIAESFSLIGKGIFKELKNIFWDHPLKSLAMAGLTSIATVALGTLMAPMLAVGAAAGIAIVAGTAALSFGGYSLYSAGKTVIQSIKHYKNRDYDKLRMDLEALGSDLVGVALSAPFMPKGLSLLRNGIKTVKSTTSLRTTNLNPSSSLLKSQHMPKDNVNSTQIKLLENPIAEPGKQVPNTISRTESAKRNSDLPGGQLVSEYLAENGSTTRKFAIIEGEEALEGFFVDGKPVQVKVYDFQSGEIKVAHVQHGSKYGVVGWEKLKGSTKPDIVLMCHPETLTSEVRALHPFPEHVGEISLHVAKRSYNPNTKKIIPMYIPQLGKYYVVWDASP